MKEQKVLFSILFFLCVSTMQMFSDSGLLMSVYGNVVKEQDQKPIGSLTVILMRIENDEVIEIKEAKTDFKGFFEIKQLKPGKYEFLLDIPGVGLDFVVHPTETDITTTTNNQFEIEDGQNLNMNFTIGIGEIPEIIIEKIKNKNQINVIYKYIEFSDETASISGIKNRKSNIPKASVESDCEISLEEVNYTEKLGTPIRRRVSSR